MLNLDSCPYPDGQGSQWSCARQATSVSYLGLVEELGQEVRIPGHVKSVMNLSLVTCKMLKLPSPVINDKLIPILSFFADVQKVLQEDRVIVYGWRKALKVRARARNRKRTIENFQAKCKPSATQNISREYRKM